MKPRKDQLCPICRGWGSYKLAGKYKFCYDCNGTGVKLPKEKFIDNGKMISFPPKGE